MSKPIVLCVDDKQTVLKSLKIEIQKALGNEYRIELAESGKEALVLIEELQKQAKELVLVIADYLMPNMTGDELLERIHALSPTTINIMLTGEADIEAISHAVNYAKLYRYITKPWQTEELRLTVKEAIYSYRQEKMLAEQNAKLQRLDKLKDELIANVSHELRTPLNGILGSSEYLYEQLKNELSEKHTELLSIIVQSGRRLNNIVNNMLDFSRLKGKNIEPKLKAVNMQEMTRIVLSLHGHKNQKLINAIPDNLPLARADENRVQQILYHLISNAIKFTERGSIEVSAEVVRRNIEREIKTPLDPNVLKTVKFSKSDTTHNLYVAITVSDTGIGIPADKIESIFESFEQVDGSINRRYEGTGLGLCLSKQLLELQGGKIFVESTEGSGSRFTFILPIASAHKVDTPLRNDSDSETATALDVNEAKRSEKTSTPAIKILIVDDDPLTLQLFVTYLSSPEYAVTTAKSGPEALAKLEDGFKPDLILLDVIMPRMTGYEVTMKIRETWPANELPVLLISAQSEVSDVVAGLEIGANDYITKPVNGKELLARITTHLTLKRLDAENSIAALVFKSSHIGIVITDANVNIIKANQAYLDLFGYTIEEILGRNPSIVSSGQHDESFYQSMWDALLTKGYWYGKMVDRRKDGKIWTSWLSISAIKDKHDKVSHYVGFLYD